MRRLFPAYTIMLLFVAMQAWAQADIAQVKQLRQRSFQKSVPPGNYSGITWLGDDRYAVVSDKSSTDGFFIFRIDIDSVKGRIRRVENLGFRSSGLPNRDAEGIAWIPERQTMMMVGEADSRIIEYNLDGHPTGWSLQLPPASKSQGYESLTYDPHSRLLWLMPEAPSEAVWGAMPLLSVNLDDTTHIPASYLYVPDAPHKKPARGRPYANGVSEVLALGGGSLLVLEREVWMAHSGARASVWCKLYSVSPTEQSVGVPMRKQLVASWKTSFPSVPPRIANYEGMTLGPRLADGSQTIILVADSQNRYKGLLRDWFKVIILRP